MKYLILAGAALLLVACSAEPGSEKWCAEKKEQPKSEWSAADAGTYAKNCLIDGMEVGSERWCEKMSEKPKGDWTADEATSHGMLDWPEPIADGKIDLDRYGYRGALDHILWSEPL